MWKSTEEVAACVNPLIGNTETSACISDDYDVLYVSIPPSNADTVDEITKTRVDNKQILFTLSPQTIQTPVKFLPQVQHHTETEDAPVLHKAEIYHDKH